MTDTDISTQLTTILEQEIDDSTKSTKIEQVISAHEGQINICEFDIKLDHLKKIHSLLGEDDYKYLMEDREWGAYYKIIKGGQTVKSLEEYGL